MTCHLHQDWVTDAGPRRLAAGEMHLWCRVVRAEQHAADFRLLSSDERRRASAFHFEADRHRYASARATLRVLLSRYTGRPAAEIQFAIGEAGKPALVRVPTDPDVRFSVSHSGGIALLGFVLGTDIGVDVEQRRVDVEMLQLASRFFSENEANQVRNTETNDARAAVFYDIWTRKEACLKAVGTGLQIALDAFSVLGPMGEKSNHVSVPLSDGPKRVTVHSVPPIEGCAAAVARVGEGPVKVWHFSTNAAETATS